MPGPWAEFGDSLLLGKVVVSLQVLMALYSTFLCLWLASIGGAIGSFLNVVVYRMPLGMQLASPGSRCPRCLSTIRMRHNIPVLGWLILKGRCYDCGLPISSRYPLVELTLAVVYGLLGYLLVVDAPYDLCPYPVQRLVNQTHGGIEGIGIWVRYGLQMLLLTTLLAAALTAYDRRPVLLRLFRPLALFVVVLPFIFPEVHHWPGNLQSQPGAPAVVLSTLGMGIGMAIAGGMAMVLTISHRAFSTASYDTSSAEAPEHDYRNPMLFSLAMTGLVLGWQVLSVVAVICLALVLLAVVLRQLVPGLYKTGTVTSWLLFCLWGGIGGALILAHRWPWLHASISTWGTFAFAVGIVCFFVSGIALRFGMPADYDEERVELSPEPVSSSPLELPATLDEHRHPEADPSDPPIS
ncbi:MAG: prepilin peptidase [Planctomycetaceae bacterium]